MVSGVLVRVSPLGVGSSMTGKGASKNVEQNRRNIPVTFLSWMRCPMKLGDNDLALSISLARSESWPSFRSVP